MADFPLPFFLTVGYQWGSSFPWDFGFDLDLRWIELGVLNALVMNLINYIRYWGISSQRSNFELHHWLHQVLGTQRLHYIKNYILYIYMCVYLLCIHRHLYHSLMFFIYLHIYTMKFVVSVRHHCRISSRMCDSIHGISAGKPLRGLGVIFTWFVTFIYLYHYIYVYV